MKVVRGRFRTGGKTIDEIRNQRDNKNLKVEELENIKKAYEEINGVELYLSLWDYDEQKMFHISGWEDKADEKIMNGTYYLEQVGFSTQYLNNREKFIKDWRNNKYEPIGSLCFEKEDVEVLETISEVDR
jgi:hypothetical protein